MVKFIKKNQFFGIDKILVSWRKSKTLYLLLQ